MRQVMLILLLALCCGCATNVTRAPQFKPFTSGPIQTRCDAVVMDTTTWHTGGEYYFGKTSTRPHLVVKVKSAAHEGLLVVPAGTEVRIRFIKLYNSLDNGWYQADVELIGMADDPHRRVVLEWNYYSAQQREEQILGLPNQVPGK